MTTSSRVVVFTTAALLGFAANSILCRLALGSGTIDAATFTGVRLATGALTLLVLSRAAASKHAPWLGGGTTGALLLFAYAAGFSLAYVRLDAGTGGLLLFGSVQSTMLLVGLLRGERPRAVEWGGFVLAASGLLALLLPRIGGTAPDPASAALMAGAGISWGLYTLLGRGESRPLAATAGNFLRTLPLAAVLCLIALPNAHASPRGVALAALSGSIASGIGYSLWYGALTRLSCTRAAIVQLAVPVLTAAAGVAFLGERVSGRLVLAAALILGGVILALVRPRAHPRPAPSAPQ